MWGGGGRGGESGVEGACPSPFCSAAFTFAQDIFLQEFHTKNTNVPYLKIVLVPIATKLFQGKHFAPITF